MITSAHHRRQALANSCVTSCACMVLRALGDTPDEAELHGEDSPRRLDWLRRVDPRLSAPFCSVLYLEDDAALSARLASAMNLGQSAILLVTSYGWSSVLARARVPVHRSSNGHHAIVACPIGEIRNGLGWLGIFDPALDRPVPVRVAFDGFTGACCPGYIALIDWSEAPKLMTDAEPHTIAPCCASMHSAGRKIVVPAVEPLDERDPIAAAREDDRRKRGMLRSVTDGHVHLWPDGIYRALWRWFDANAWRIAFRGSAEDTLEALSRSGVSRAVSLLYAHKPGIARELNRFAAELARAHPWVTALGTASPEDPDAVDIVREALGPLGLRGIKLHCHVQRAAIDDPRVLAILRACADAGAPAVVHCGREPATDAYGVDTYALCDHARCERALQAVPGLRLVVPHVGLDEFAPYLALVDRYEGLYLDTSMACAEYFEHTIDWDALSARADRVLYGTDFPITPYEYERELRVLARRISDDGAFERIVRGTCARLWPA